MTDKLTPGQLRDLADIIDAIPSGEYGAPHFREEAARREAEQLDPVGTASLAASLAQSKDKAAPAADDLVKRLRKWAKVAEHIAAKMVCNEAADRIEAQAREIAATNDHLDIAQATCNMQIERANRAEAENAHLREALALILPLARGYARTYDYNSNREYVAIAEAALARGGDHG